MPGQTSLRFSEMPALPPDQKIRFHFLDKGVYLTHRKKLKAFIASLFKKEKKSFVSLDYIFCSDEYLLNINKSYLRHDFYTDIITFDLSDTASSGRGAIAGEVYISLDRVRDNAGNFDASLKKELHRVIFHGALHLCGYKDKTSGDSQLMRQKEDEYLQLYLDNA